MTVTSTTNSSRQLGNGATVAFATTIKVFTVTSSNLVVQILDRTTSAVLNTLILNDGGALGFTVVFDTDAETMTVTVNTAPLGTEDIFIQRTLLQTQETDLPLATKFPSEAVENALDKNIMVVQDQQSKINSTLSLPASVSGVSTVLPIPVSNQLLGWNLAADALENKAANTGLGDMISTNNLNDVADVPTSRTNLGLGSAAVANLLDENDMASNSATDAASQKSIKAHVAAELGLNLLATATASNSTSIDFTAFIDGTFDEYIFKGIDIIPITDNVNFFVRVSEDAGSSFKAGASDYRFLAYGGEDGGAIEFGSNSAATAGIIQFGSALNNDADQSFNFTLHLANPADTASRKIMYGQSSGELTGGDTVFSKNFVVRYVGTTNAVDAIQFLASSGNISSGEFKLYGVKK